jgi:hypothetical protein
MGSSQRKMSKAAMAQPMPLLTSANGKIQRAYSSSEIDALAAYCPHLERCFLVPISRIDGRPTVHLRVAPARNNQARGVNRA